MATERRKLVLDVGGKRKPMVGVVVSEKLEGADKASFTGITDFEDLVEERAVGCDAIVLAMPGPISADGMSARTPNLPEFSGVPLVTLIQNLTGKTTKLVNDMSAAATGMAQLCPDTPNFLALTLSSGVGLRWVCDGRVVSHKVEMGHLCLDHSGPPCACGAIGCIEAFIGGEANKPRIRHFAKLPSVRDGRASDFLLEIVDDHDDNVNVWEIMDKAFAAGEYWAITYYAGFAKFLGQALAAWRCCIEYDTVIYKGTTALKMPKAIWSDALVEMRRRLPINPGWADIRTIPSPDPDHDALIGAATLFEQDWAR